MEHRWGDRIRSGGVVRLVASPASIAWGRLRDISMTGAFIETQMPLAPLSTLQVAALGGAPHAAAIVVRRETDGVGIEWLDGDAEGVLVMIQDARERSFGGSVPSDTGRIRISDHSSLGSTTEETVSCRLRP